MLFKRNPFNADNIHKVYKTIVLKFTTCMTQLINSNYKMWQNSTQNIPWIINILGYLWFHSDTTDEMLYQMKSKVTQ